MGIYDRDYYREDRRGMLNSVIPEGGVCKFLIVAQIVVFVLQWINLTNISLADSLGLQLSGLQQGEVWRAFTFSFVHSQIGLLGLAFNLFFIWYFGIPTLFPLEWQQWVNRNGSEFFFAFIANTS